ncbi:MAG: ribokinase [Acidobacteriota bacterium]
MIVVVGSLNMDLLIRCERIPAPGETLLGEKFETAPGGKGANQAYAAARLSRGRVRMIGKVGRDDYGRRLRENLAGVGVDVEGVKIVEEAPTGVAAITLDGRGQNAIVVASGANFVWRRGEAAGMRGILEGATHVLLQLETPVEVVGVFLRMAKECGAMTSLDPAPARELPRDWWPLLDLVTPNEVEAGRIGQVPEEKLLCKRGEKGSRWRDVEVGAIAVEAVDTTGAGDTYNAALAVGLSEGLGMREAMRMASVAAGISVTRVGAQSSAPAREEVDAYGVSW